MLLSTIFSTTFYDIGCISGLRGKKQQFFLHEFITLPSNACGTDTSQWEACGIHSSNWSLYAQSKVYTFFHLLLSDQPRHACVILGGGKAACSKVLKITWLQSQEVMIKLQQPSRFLVQIFIPFRVSFCGKLKVGLGKGGEQGLVTPFAMCCMNVDVCQCQLGVWSSHTPSLQTFFDCPPLSVTCHQRPGLGTGKTF